MNKKQKKEMLLKESMILGAIGIVIGIIIGIFLSFILTQLLQTMLNNLADNYISLNLGSKYFHIITNGTVKLKMNIPILVVGLTIVIIYLIVFISSMLPMRRVNKMSAIDAIRDINNKKIKRKSVKTPKFISKIFGGIGELAYKNIRHEKSKYRTIVISLTCSIVIFLVTSSFITNVFSDTDYKLEEYKYEYHISRVKKDEIDEIINYLNEDKLIKEYCILNSGASISNTNIDYIKVPENKITDSMKEAENEGLHLISQSKKLEDGSMQMFAYTEYMLGDAYQDILNRAGVKELKENEVIITNTTKREHSKFGDVIQYTKFETRRYSYIRK